MVILLFTRSHGAYQAGEVATFPDRHWMVRSALVHDGRRGAPARIVSSAERDSIWKTQQEAIALARKAERGDEGLVLVWLENDEAAGRRLGECHRVSAAEASELLTREVTYRLDDGCEIGTGPLTRLASRPEITEDYRTLADRILKARREAFEAEDDT